MRPLTRLALLLISLNLFAFAGCDDGKGSAADMGSEVLSDATTPDTTTTDVAVGDVPADVPADQTSPADLTSTNDGTVADGTTADTAGDTVVTGSLCDRIGRGPNADLRNAKLLPSNSYWYESVANAEVDPNSAAIVAHIGSDTGLHPDFGCCWPDSPFGIPYIVVDGNVAPVNVAFDYDTESDPGPYPIPVDAPIEGGPDASGDRHVLVIDCAAEKLYELFSAYPQTDGSWTAGSGSIWDLSQNDIREVYCTSADAAGLPILPGLVRYDEVAAGEIHHAIRFTVSQSRRAFLYPPATHWASSDTSPDAPPMGMRMRLKSDAELLADGVDVSTFDPQVRVILRALQTYGLILADNGSDFYMSGMPSASWNDDALVSELRQVRGRHFDVIKMEGLVDDTGIAPGDCVLP
ncbi:MAG: hypothetical protein CO108_02700 [Deltaproteobacteria bacterium CG_4_9_14_3_um_filter_63_12]|nr:MAG: hypothetical protein CO108_02700 [Deltaproteobacteria bacterium CG_4_9_14_3_um_filter_63_12]